MKSGAQLMANFKTVQLNVELYDLLEKKRKELEKELGFKVSLAQTISYMLNSKTVNLNLDLTRGD